MPWTFGSIFSPAFDKHRANNVVSSLSVGPQVTYFIRHIRPPEVMMGIKNWPFRVNNLLYYLRMPAL